MGWKGLAVLAVFLMCDVAGLAQTGESGSNVAAPKRRPTVAQLADATEKRRRLGLTPEYAEVPGVELVKVAVLDYGFDGIDGAHPYLPENAVVVENYDPDFVRRFSLGDPDYHKPFELHNRHGRAMAQIIWAVTGLHPNGPKFYLLNANGPTMLRRAVRYAIERKVDVILFSGAFEGGGNGDGSGPINRVVADAIAANILWVNAAGNYGRHVYNGPVRIDEDGYLRFRDGFDGTSLRFRNRVDENTLTITLTWNDYREEEDAGTNKDLDLYVEDVTGKVVGSSEKVQVSGAKVPGSGESRNPRERVVLTDLPANRDFNYRIRVRAKTRNFGRDDRIRVLVAASRESYLRPGSDAPDEAVKFFDATGKGEVYPPADNPLVLTVGDTGPDSAVGPTADGRVKPDVVLEDSQAFFSDGDLSAGSSNAAAYVAGVVAVLKAAEPGLRMRHLLQFARREGTAPRAEDAHNSNLERTLVRERPLDPAAAVAAAPPLERAEEVVAVDPFGRMVVVQAPRPPLARNLTRRSGAAAGETAELLPAPRRSASRLEAPQSPKDRVWWTPSRDQLDALIRRDR